MYKKKVKYRNFYLFPKNSFLIGFGSVFNLAGNYFDYNYSTSSEKADRKALSSDWINVGNDLSKVKQQLDENLV